MLKEKLFMSLSEDLLFKEAFTHIDNRHILIDYLATMTNFTKEYLESLNISVVYESIMDKTKLSDKSMRGDIIIKFDKYIINLESYTYFDALSFDKSTSYIMRIFSTQLDRGKDYNLLESVIQINIIDNVEIPFTNNVKSNYYLTNEEDINDKKLADKFIIKYYRIDKAREMEYNENDREIRWLKFIGAKSAEERKMIAKGDEILMAMDNFVYEYINDDKTKKLFGEWAEYIASEKARKIALKEGLEQGKIENSKKIIKNLLSMNTSLEDISKITGLTLEEINELSKN